MQSVYRAAALAAIVCVPQVFAQTAGPTFDVASVKPNKSGDMGMRIMVQPGGRFTATNITLKFLIRMSYGVQDFQISGGPSWMGSDRFDIEARAADGEPGGDLRSMTEEQRQANMERRKQMIRALLADRFQLTLHKESKDAPIYALVPAKGGIKMKEEPPQEIKPDSKDLPDPDKPDPKRPMRGGLRMGRGELKGDGIKLSFLADALSDQVGRKVLDKTGLKGDYSFELKWTPDENHDPGFHSPSDAQPSGESNGPTVFTALQEQLGLKLDPQRGPVDLLVIDHAEKASEN